MSDNEVIATIQSMMNKFNDEKFHKKFRKWNKTMTFVFTDISKAFHSVITEGTPSEVVEGEPEKSDITIITDSETWKGIMDGSISGMNAYTSKKLKVKGKMTDLLKMQKLM